MHPLACRSVLLGAATVLVACVGPESPDLPLEVDLPVEAGPLPVTVTIMPAAVTAHAGTGQGFMVRAAVRGVDGRELTGVQVGWATSDPSIAEIGASRSEKGLRPVAWVVARGKPGSVTITATVSGEMGAGAVTLKDLSHAGIASIAMGQADRLCVLTSAGEPYCQGEGSDRSSTLPVLVPGAPAFETISVGRNHSCALTVQGAAYCWGWNSSGQLGATTTDNCGYRDEHLRISCQPLAVTGGHTFVRITVGRFHSCGLTKQGTVYCWGERYGESPTVLAPEHRFVKIDAGLLHTCGLTDAGAAYCWGPPYTTWDWGIDYHLDPGREPLAVAAGSTFSDITVGSESSIGGEQDHACGLTREGAIYCWLAAPAAEVRPFPVPLPEAVRLTAIDGGLRHTCGLAVDGAVYCWGWTYDWDAFARMPFPPHRVNGPAFLSISSGGGGFDGEEGRACGLTNDRIAYCWDPAVGQPWRIIR